MYGIPVLSTNSLSIFAVSFLFAPAPISKTGDFAASIISTARLMALYSAIGLLATLGVSTWADVSSAAISSGNSI